MIVRILLGLALIPLASPQALPDTEPEAYTHQIACGTGAAYLLAKATNHWAGGFESFENKTSLLSKKSRHSLEEIRAMLDQVDLSTEAFYVSDDEILALRNEPLIVHVDLGEDRPGHFALMIGVENLNGVGEWHVFDPFEERSITVSDEKLRDAALSGAILRVTRPTTGNYRLLAILGSVAFLAVAGGLLFRGNAAKRRLANIAILLTAMSFCSACQPVHDGETSVSAIPPHNETVKTSENEFETIATTTDRLDKDDLVPQAMPLADAVDAELFELVAVESNLESQSGQKRYFYCHGPQHER